MLPITRSASRDHKKFYDKTSRIYFLIFPKAGADWAYGVGSNLHMRVQTQTFSRPAPPAIRELIKASDHSKCAESPFILSCLCISNYRGQAADRNKLQHAAARGGSIAFMFGKPSSVNSNLLFTGHFGGNFLHIRNREYTRFRSPVFSNYRSHPRSLGIPVYIIVSILPTWTRNSAATNMSELANVT